MTSVKIPRRHFLQLAGAAVAVPGAARGDDPLDDLLSAQMRDRGLPGLAVAVMVAGRMVSARARGFADLALHRPATPRTVFQLASVTKQFVAAAVMLLVQDGKTSTDALLTEHLDGLPDTWNGVRVRHLLSHTSGIEDYLSAIPATYDLGGDPELRALVRTMPLQFQPGDQWHYSNSNYLLLGHLIERISGTPYDRFLDKRVFRPLGMASTRRRVLGDPAIAVGYTLGANGSAPTPARFLPPALWDNADGGLVSTVEDMAKWDRALSAGTIVSARSLEEMVRRTTLNDGRIQDYGYGLVVNVIGTHRVVGHGGSRPGVATNFTRWPDDGVSVAVLCNAQLGGNDPFEMARSIARLYAPAVP